MKALTITLLVALLSCASTRMTSTLNPEYSHKSYQRFLVVASITDLDLKQKLETRLCARLSTRGANCKRDCDLFFPGKEYTDDEVWDRILAESIDAILIVTPLVSGVSTSKLPERQHTKTKGRIRRSATGYSYKEKSKTYTTGGQTLYKPWANFEVELWDVDNDDIVWYATARTGGNAFASFTTVVHSIAGKTVNKLSKAGLIKN